MSAQIPSSGGTSATPRRPVRKRVRDFAEGFALYLGIGPAIIALTEGIAATWRAFTATNVQAIVFEEIRDLTWFIFTLCFVLGLLIWQYNRKQTRLRTVERDYAKEVTWRAGQQKMNVDISLNRADISRAHAEYCSLLRERMLTGRVDDLDQKLQTYLDSVLAATADLFETYTTYKCGACIKVFSTDKTPPAPPSPLSKDGIPPYVFTFRRDPSSAIARKGIDLRYPVYEYRDNAAFRSILSTPRKREFFMSNNLAALASGGAYFSAHDEWPKHYNAAIVVPVEEHGSSLTERCTALLCVDNLKGRFDDDRCIHILNGIAMDVYYAMWTTSWLYWRDANNEETVHAA